MADLLPRPPDLRRLIEHNLDIVCLLDATGNLLYLNPAVERVLGYRPEELRGINLVDLIHRNDVERTVAFLAERVAIPGVAPTIEIRVRHRDGAWHLLEIIGTNLLDDPDVGALLVNARDITEWDAARLALQQSEERYRAYVEQSGEGIWRFEFDPPVPTTLEPDEQVSLFYESGTLAECNDALARMYALSSASEFVGARPEDFLPRDAPQSQGFLRRFIDSGYRLVDAETRDRDREGNLRHFLNNLVGVIQDGKLVRTWGVTRDITQRKVNEERLRDGEARLALMLGQLPAVMWTTDRELRFTTSLGAGLQSLGLKPMEAVGTSLYEYFGTDDPEFHEIAQHRAALEGRSASFESEWVGQAFETHVEPLRDAQGAITGTLGLAINVTERRQLEEQLRQSQKMEAIGQLTGGIAHDFNNLLTVVLTNAELLAAGLPDHEVEMAGDVAEIQSAARRGSGMIKKLLGFSRRDMLAIRSVQIAQVLGEFAGTLARILPEDIELQMEPVDPDLIVRADEAAVEQILINLATNARDAMSKGGTLTIAARPIAQGPRDEDRFISLVVTDTGIGMTPDVLEHAFDPFFTTKPPDKGSGLGLAMIYGLARQHRGSVELLSEPGRGTTVMVNLPAAAAIDPRPRHESPGPETLPGGSETILVVEDEPAIRNAARRVLVKYGYSVIEAADGFEALELFDQHEPQIDLIVCDVVMPKLGGQRVLDALRLEGKSVPFLFTSGHTSRGGMVSHGIDESMPFLPKPWNAAELLVAVRTLLDDRP